MKRLILPVGEFLIQSDDDEKSRRHRKEKRTFQEQLTNRSDMKQTLLSKITFPVILKSKETTKNRVSREMFTSLLCWCPTVLVKSLKTGPKTKDGKEYSSRSLSSCPR